MPSTPPPDLLPLIQACETALDGQRESAQRTLEEAFDSFLSNGHRLGRENAVQLAALVRNPNFDLLTKKRAIDLLARKGWTVLLGVLATDPNISSELNHHLVLAIYNAATASLGAPQNPLAGSGVLSEPIRRRPAGPAARTPPPTREKVHV